MRTLKLDVDSASAAAATAHLDALNTKATEAAARADRAEAELDAAKAALETAKAEDVVAVIEQNVGRRSSSSSARSIPCRWFTYTACRFRIRESRGRLTVTTGTSRIRSRKARCGGW